MESFAGSEVESSLLALPVRIQHSIYRLVDPIAIVSLSQTNRRLRNSIKLGREYFVERLLLLECIEEFGGPRYSFSLLQNKFTILMGFPRWDDIRIACPGCLRLRHHINFTHQYLARLRFQKPLRGSTPENTTTSWEPSYRGKLWGKSRWRHRVESGVSAEERAARKRYRIIADHRNRAVSPTADRAECLAQYQACGIEAFQKMTIEEFAALDYAKETEILEAEVKEYELTHMGCQRWKRRCNECLFKAGVLPGRHGVGISLEKVPIVRKCLLQYKLPCDRWMPGAADMTNGKRPERDSHDDLFLIARFSATGFWQVYSARCPSCEKWQEARALRFCDDTLMDIPRHEWASDWKDNKLIEHTSSTEYVRNLRCNHCVGKEDGTGKLQRVLVEWLRYILNWQMRGIQQKILDGLPEKTIRDRVPAELLQNRRTGIGRAPKTVGGASQNWTQADMALIVGRHLESSGATREDPRSDAADAARHRHDTKGADVKKLQELWDWMRVCEERLDEDSSDLAELALAQNGASLACGKSSIV